ncbi:MULTISPECIES: hypothetical protein [Halomonas]|uniref:Uncharacterized protein n=1 Tax=Halomonas ventosae TaxID=229007 RepID=A0A4R6HE09_9GAMM|nr:hypothetical protein [Halomonas ventosae]TDO06101.1 hypothetical protein DFO68_11221 [Halomonas ventosae]
MTMNRHAQPASHVARNASVACAVRGDWHGFWFIPEVPVAIS